MADPVILPPSVEEIIKKICRDKHRDPPDTWARQRLAAAGERVAAQVLAKIYNQTTQIRNLSRLIVWLIDNPQSPLRVSAQQSSQSPVGQLQSPSNSFYPLRSALPSSSNYPHGAAASSRNLFDVVARRAKLVAGEKSDEQINFQTPEASSPGMIPHEEVGNDTDDIEAATSRQAETMASESHEEKAPVSSSDAHEVLPLLATKDVDNALGYPPAESNQSTLLGDTKSPEPIQHERTPVSNVDGKADNQLKDADLKLELVPDKKKDPENLETERGSDQKKDPDCSTGISAVKVQEQLDKSQGLLKSAVSAGQSKEASLARVCAGLSSRLEEYKSENVQLEGLLFAERELSKSYEDGMKQLQKDLSVSKSEVAKVESNMADALAAKNAEIEVLVISMGSMMKQAALSEGNLASLQANVESIMRNRGLTDTRMMQVLKEELAAAERRAEEECAAHNATKMAAMDREVELEHRAIEASTALARIQRTADERTAKAADLEKKIALLEAECASLNQELQEMEDHARHGQKKSPEEANQVIQMQAWQEEVEHARQGQRDAENQLSAMEAEVQKMRVEMAARKRDAEHYSRQEHMELEKRYRELTDLLYYKQAQLETMASEKAAAEIQLEKELKRLQEAEIEPERSDAKHHPLGRKTLRLNHSRLFQCINSIWLGQTCRRQSF